jgi:hypothetical protein
MVVVASVALVAGAGATAWFLRGTPRSEVRPQRTSPVAQAPVATPPLSPASASPSVPPQEFATPRSSELSFGMAIVHYSAGVDTPSNALGRPDRGLAVVRAGLLTLQMPDGQQLVSDGTPAADVRIESEPSMPGPYRVEIGVGHNRFILVADGVQGAASVDIDHAGVRVGRFVRVSTRASGAALALDAVLVRVPVANPAATP